MSKSSVSNAMIWIGRIINTLEDQDTPFSQIKSMSTHLKEILRCILHHLNRRLRDNTFKLDFMVEDLVTCSNLCNNKVFEYTNQLTKDNLVQTMNQGMLKDKQVFKGYLLSANEVSKVINRLSSFAVGINICACVCELIQSDYDGVSDDKYFNDIIYDAIQEVLV